MNNWALTNQHQSRIAQPWPFKQCVQDILPFAVQLIHLIQHQHTTYKEKQLVSTFTFLTLQSVWAGLTLGHIPTAETSLKILICPFASHYYNHTTPTPMIMKK